MIKDFMIPDIHTYIHNVIKRKLLCINITLLYMQSIYCLNIIRSSQLFVTCCSSRVNSHQNICACLRFNKKITALDKKTEKYLYKVNFYSFIIIIYQAWYGHNISIIIS